MITAAPSIPILWPVGGLVEDVSYLHQPDGTTPDALNVMTYESRDGRRRGGVRPGLIRHIAQPVNGANRIQELNKVTVAIDQRTIEIDEQKVHDDFSGVDGTILQNPSNWVEWSGTVPVVDVPNAFTTDVPDGSAEFKRLNNRATYDLATAAVGEDVSVALVRLETAAEFRASDRFILSSVITPFTGDLTGATSKVYSQGLMFRVDPANDEGFWGGWLRSSLADNHRIVLVKYDRGTQTTLAETDDLGFNRTKAITNMTWTESTRQLNRLGEFANYEYSPGDTITITAGTGATTGVYVIESKISDDDIKLKSSIGALADGSANIDGTVTKRDDHSLQVNVNQNAIQVHWDGTQLEFPNGTLGGAGVRTLDISAQGFDTTDHKQTALYADRQSGAAAVWDNGVAQVSTFDDFTVFSAVQPATFTRTELVTVSGGQIYSGSGGDFLTQANHLTPASTMLDPNEPAVESVEFFQKVYLMDGFNYKVFDPGLGTVEDWNATAGTLPGGNGSEGELGSGTADGNQRCTFGVLWQGRLAMAGKRDDLRNSFLSRIGDALDHDYGAPATDPARAIAGQAGGTGFGLFGDIITALIPYNDDTLIYGGQRSISILTGNPSDSNSGAVFQSLSRDVGVVGPRAWTVGPNRIIYVFCTNGIYAISPNSFNIDENNRISAGRLDRVFSQVNYATHKVELHWDVSNHGLWIFINTLEAAAADLCYFWDQRSNSFWPVQFPNSMNPASGLVFDGDGPVDRVILMGGYDSVIRKIDITSDNDDGTNIASRAFIGPLRDVDPGKEFRMEKLRAVFDEQSDAVNWSLHVGDTAEAALGAAAWVNGSFSSGRNPAVCEPTRGYAAYLRLGAALGRWELEEAQMELETAGIARERS